MKYLAIDLGDRRTGLALCDSQETICSPYTVLQARDRLCLRISEIITEERIEALVIGLPLNMDGSEGSQAKKVHEFIKELSQTVSLPIHLQDERLSSFSARGKLTEMGLNQKKQKGRLDAIAAAEILQAFLDTKAAGLCNGED